MAEGNGGDFSVLVLSKVSLTLQCREKDRLDPFLQFCDG